jgi:hypothetical protein
MTLMTATLFDPEGNAVNWLESYYRGDSFVFRFADSTRQRIES